MKNRDKLKKYIPLVEFISKVLGENSEVVLHDIKNPDNSIVAIENGSISGRKINGPLTDLALKIIKDKSYKDKNYICNYKGNSKGNKIFRSSSYFLKDDNKELIGMICVNTDISDILKARDVLNKFINTDEEKKEVVNSDAGDLNIFEHLDENVEDVIKSVIDTVLVNMKFHQRECALKKKFRWLRS